MGAELSEHPDQTHRQRAAGRRAPRSVQLELCMGATVDVLKRHTVNLLSAVSRSTQRPQEVKVLSKSMTLVTMKVTHTNTACEKVFKDVIFNVYVCQNQCSVCLFIQLKIN